MVEKRGSRKFKVVVFSKGDSEIEYGHREEVIRFDTIWESKVGAMVTAILKEAVPFKSQLKIDITSKRFQDVCSECNKRRD